MSTTAENCIVTCRRCIGAHKVSKTACTYTKCIQSRWKAAHRNIDVWNCIRKVIAAPFVYRFIHLCHESPICDILPCVTPAWWYNLFEKPQLGGSLLRQPFSRIEQLHICGYFISQICEESVTFLEKMCLLRFMRSFILIIRLIYSNDLINSRAYRKAGIPR